MPDPAVAHIPLTLPDPLRAWLDGAVRALLQADGEAVDFARPPGEPALAPHDSVCWQVFRNPVALFVGGVTAVILELAEPRVRTGVWEHTGFRSDPAARLRRTGLAAMVTIYAARSTAASMIAGIRRRHDAIAGVTPAGEPYRASDPDLLDWVQATAAFGFLQAYQAYVRPLPAAERDRYYAEAVPAALLYGASGAPASEAAMQALLAAMQPRLEPSAIVADFLAIMRGAPLLPAPLRPLQRLLVRAAIDLVPPALRTLLRLDPRPLAGWQRAALRRAGALADRVVLPSSPAVQACRRLGLPDDYLVRRVQAGR